MQRYKSAIRHPANWFQLGRFIMVGASGFVINLVIFAVLVHATDIPYVLAAVISNSIAIANNFFLHRMWTFRATADQKRHQGLRFLAVCMVGFGINLVVLRFGVEVLSLSKVFAEVIAAGVAAPVTFVINRQWAFRNRAVATQIGSAGGAGRVRHQHSDTPAAADAPAAGRV